MSRRKQQGVDASSIADIAFILLAFIIIATTLEKESGLPAVLPQKRDNPTEKPPEINEKNILEILINKDDQLLIEGEWDKKLEDIVDVVKEFMTNPNDADFLPRMDVVTLDECIKNIAILNKLLKSFLYFLHFSFKMMTGHDIIVNGGCKIETSLFRKNLCTLKYRVKIKSALR